MIETRNKMHCVPVSKAFQINTIRYDVFAPEIRQNDVTRWRHFWKYEKYNFFYWKWKIVVSASYMQNLSTIRPTVMTSLTFLSCIFVEPEQPYFSFVNYLHISHL